MLFSSGQCQSWVIIRRSMIVHLISMAITRFGLGLRADAIVAAEGQSRCRAHMNRRTLILSNATKRSTMSAGLVASELRIVELGTDRSGPAFMRFRGLPIRTINCTSLQIRDPGPRGGIWVLELFWRVPSISIRPAQHWAFCIASIGQFRVLRPEFLELAGGVWMWLYVDGFDATFSRLLSCCASGWRWGIHGAQLLGPALNQPKVDNRTSSLLRDFWRSWTANDVGEARDCGRRYIWEWGWSHSHRMVEVPWILLLRGRFHLDSWCV